LRFHGLESLPLDDLYISHSKDLDESTAKRIHYFPNVNKTIIPYFKEIDIIKAGVQVFLPDRSETEVSLRLTYEGAVLFKDKITK